MSTPPQYVLFCTMKAKTTLAPPKVGIRKQNIPSTVSNKISKNILSLDIRKSIIHNVIGLPAN